MARSTSSLESDSSQRSSHEQSVHKQHHETDISTETLISYLVAAKRSLSSIHLVHRATTVLADARSSIEAAAVFVSRTQYLRRSLASQLKLLRRIQYEIEGGAQVVKSEIQATLTELENVDRLLSENIDSLQATRVEPGFKDTPHHDAGASAEISNKNTLHDFVDGRPVEAIKNTIQTAIDEAEAAEATIDENVRSLEDEMQALNSAMSQNHTVSSSTIEPDLKSSRISHTLKILESHAREMAVSLESLVDHFDLCVTAIKHTEGASALVAKAVSEEGLPEGVNVNDLTGPTVTDLSREEHAEMLQVLANDAAEVDEVVMEIQDRFTQMEATLDRLYQWRDLRQREYEDVQSAFSLLEQSGAKLPSYAAEISGFANRWHKSKARILDGQAALTDLTTVYGQFLDSYDGLIVEAARRKAAKKNMLKVVQEAHAKLEQLYAEDLNEREIFRIERGDFLPSDIWSGLGSLPPRWVMHRVDHNSSGGGGDDNDDSVPELPKKTVQDALARLRKKMQDQDSAGNRAQSN